MTRTWTEAEIAAFMAGAMPEPDASRIAEALETDPAAAEAAERIGSGATAQDALLRDAFAAPLNEPAPAPMRAALLAAPGKVTALPARRARPAWAPMALAASLALTVGLGAGLGLRPGAQPPVAAVVGVGVAAGAALTALESAPSGQVVGDVRVASSFRDAAGEACRELEHLDAAGAVQGVGLACRRGEVWRILMLADAPQAPDGQGEASYAPAGGAAFDPMAAALDQLGAGPALSPEEEATLLARGWR